MTPKPFLVLIADDSEADRYFSSVPSTLARPGFDHPEVGTGAGAIDYLSGRGPFADRDRFPCPNSCSRFAHARHDRPRRP